MQITVVAIITESVSLVLYRTNMHVATPAIMQIVFITAMTCEKMLFLNTWLNNFSMITNAVTIDSRYSQLIDKKFTIYFHTSIFLFPANIPPVLPPSQCFLDKILPLQ